MWGGGGGGGQWLQMTGALMLPNAYSHCLFNVTVSDMKSRSAHAFMCVMVVVVAVCVCMCMEWVVFIAIA